MHLFAFFGWCLLVMVAHLESAPVIKNKNANQGDVKVVVSICSNQYNDLMRDLRNNWESPIMYLKSRGYIPRNSEPHMGKGELELSSETCSVPREIETAEPEDMIEASKYRQHRAGAVKGLLAINNPTDPPTQRAQVPAPQGMAIYAKTYPYQNNNQPPTMPSQSMMPPSMPLLPPPPTPNLTQEGKTFLKHIKEKVMGLFKGCKTPTNMYGRQDFNGNSPTIEEEAYSAEDFDREFERLLSQNHKDDQNELDDDLDKEIDKKFDKVAASQYDSLLNTKLDINRDFLKTVSNQARRKDPSKMYSSRMLPKR